MRYKFVIKIQNEIRDIIKEIPNRIEEEIPEIKKCFGVTEDPYDIDDLLYQHYFKDLCRREEFTCYAWDLLK